jgi:hypothetical protein
MRLLMILPWATAFHQALALTTAFTYQGRLDDGGAPANGIYDFRFMLYYDPARSTQAAAPFLTNAIPVTNGLFTATIDFGQGVFTGSDCWLEVNVRRNGEVSYTVLNPLQNLTPAPHAQFAVRASNLTGALPAEQINGTLPLATLPSAVLTNNQAGVTLSGTFTGNGNGLTNLNANQIANLNVVANMKVFTNSGPFIVPTNVSRIMVELWGGGGGGGAYSSPYFGGGGGGGGYAKGVFAVRPVEMYMLTVGAEGTGSSEGIDNATAGGNSTFAQSGFPPLMTATGGGAGSTASGAQGTPGISGSSDGAFSVSGGYAGANGASAGNGGAGGTTITTITQRNGIAPGGGGAGGNGTFPSGNGASGRAVIYY